MAVDPLLMSIWLSSPPLAQFEAPPFATKMSEKPSPAKPSWLGTQPWWNGGGGGENPWAEDAPSKSATATALVRVLPDTAGPVVTCRGRTRSGQRQPNAESGHHDAKAAGAGPGGTTRGGTVSP